MSLLTVILLSTSAMLSLSTLSICKQKKPKKINKPEPTNEFENPENEESDTYFGLNSTILFPDREKGRVNKTAVELAKSAVSEETQPAHTQTSDVRVDVADQKKKARSIPS
uniref:Uncharacterized protein n=1 Tax=Haemonchus contortus TaxID=6289 RepID=A0A7I4YTS5_HAECO